MRLFDFGGRKLRYVKATLPAGWRLDPEAARDARQFFVRMTGATPKVRVTRRSVTAYSQSEQATDVRVKLGGRVVVPTSARSRRARSVAVRLRLAFTDGTVQTQTLTVRTR